MTELPSVRVTRTGVQMDGAELPGLIAEGGVEFRPGGASDVNTLTVTFIVGQFEAEDSTL